MKKIKEKPIKIFLMLFGGLVVLALTAMLVLLAVQLRDPVNLASFQECIRSLGVGGWLVLFAIQYVQIVIAFIPGGPIQVVAGALFGPLGGITVCLAGMLLATATVFALVQRYGHRVIGLFVKERELKQYKFLNDAKRLEKLVFLLFLLPGAPKDVLTYLFALTPIPLTRFMLISTVARAPAALTSVFAGNSVADGQWIKALVFFAVLTGVSALGLVLHRKLMAFYHKKHHGVEKKQ